MTQLPETREMQKGQPPRILWFPLVTTDGRERTLTAHRWDRETGEISEIGSRRFTPRMFDNFLKGKFRLYWHEQLLLKPLTNKERHIYNEAVQNGYVIRTKSTRNAAGFYYYWCEVNCRPNIEVRPKRKYAQIEVDFISIPGSKGFSEAAGCKVKALITQYRGDLKPGSWYGLGGIYTYFYICKNKASALARTLWELALADMGSQYGDIDDPCLGERIHQDHMTRRFSGAL